jgi:diacylglycerol kinase (ATP)
MVKPPVTKEERDYTENILFGTMEIDPVEYSAYSTQNQNESTLFAMAGLLFLFRRQRSIRLLTVVTIVSLTLAITLGVELSSILVMMIAIGLVWIAEILNTAIEALVNLVSQEFHPMAKVTKDVAAAATFVSSMLASAVTLLTIIPRLLELWL